MYKQYPEDEASVISYSFYEPIKYKKRFINIGFNFIWPSRLYTWFKNLFKSKKYYRKYYHEELKNLMDKNLNDEQ